MSSTNIIHGYICTKCGHNRFRTKNGKTLFICRKCGQAHGYCNRPKKGGAA